MRLDESSLRPLHGYEEGRSEALDRLTIEVALAYKRDFLKHFIPIGPDQIARRLGDGPYYVTRKYDGEYAAVVYDHGTTVAVNRSGRVRRGLPCLKEAGERLARAGIGQGIFAAELYAGDGRRSGRIGRLLEALADEEGARGLQLAFFDILSIEEEPFRPRTYEQTWGRLRALFGGGGLCHPVEMEVAPSGGAVAALYHRWVEEEGSEGLVVRSALPFVFKIKPRHRLDAVVVGFAEGTGEEQGQVRSLLLALMPDEAHYEVIGRVGSGLAEADRRMLWQEFSRRIVASDWVESDANLVAFRMIRPETVVEVSVGDLLFEGSSGPIQSPLLLFGEGGYRLEAMVEGLRVTAPVFGRVREDKRADAVDARLGQIERLTAFDPAACFTRPVDLPPSRLLLREVYRKVLGGRTMVQKYLVWSTGKEASGDFPAYVLSYTNYSVGRADPLYREIDASSSLEQILDLKRRAVQSHVKRGWVRVEDASHGADPESAGEGPRQGSAKEPAAKASTEIRKSLRTTPAAPVGPTGAGRTAAAAGPGRRTKKGEP